ncbi:hypothetical protein PTI45_02759 [Paenibacillus nuruki]|uniref:Uncharacterized protein n=1 Tax=Paenibacillus nuruki TaxID=1886670 RepID=A0A1E3L4Q1_9BACL|nr:hypothetical protein [Paenibacillus nuruki]ODP27940.1 hypothetical protein PTI45_02759 [Paenibacillus nuruki]
MKKIVLATMSSVILMGTVVSSVSAANLSEISSTATSVGEISVELQQKADPYVIFEDSQFKLSPSASQVLNTDELALVTTALQDANSQAKLALENDQVHAVVGDKGIKITYVQPSSGITIKSINTSSYADQEIFWWGYRYYFSHQLIQDIKNHPLYLTGGGSITTGVLNAILTKLGIYGWVANVLVGVYLIKGGQVLYADQGRGVYLDAFWGGTAGVVTFVTAKVYPA